MIITKTCPECNGYGFTAVSTDYPVISRFCKKCSGTGIVDICATHKDLLQRADTEELSEWLAKISHLGCPPGYYCIDVTGYPCVSCWREWLEQTGNPEDTLYTAIDHK